MMVKKVTDLDILRRMWELSRLEQSPTDDEVEEFSELKDQLERSLEQSLALEERTRRLVRYLLAA
jgi:hypothetical protein